MASQPISNSGALRDQLLEECAVLARYALASGMSVPVSAIQAIEKARFAPADQPMDAAALVKAHDQLSKLVAPATPRALMVMGDEHNHGSRLAWAGSVGFVRRMMAAALVSVLVFIALSATEYTSSAAAVDAARQGLAGDSASAIRRFTIDNSWGLPLLINELFWISAAAIGASFALLRQVNDYIVARNYDPKYEPTYWIKFLLGVMAGFIMATLLPAAIGAEGPDTHPLTVSTLAMLGGFSASAVYRILTKLVESMENVFRSSPRDEAVQREKAAQAKAGEEIAQMRVNMASRLVALQHELASGKDASQLSETLRGMLGTLMPTGPAPEPAPAPGQDAAPPAPAVALPNTPIVSDAGVVQPPVAVAADEPAAVAEPAAVSADAAAGEAEGSWTPPVEDESGGEADQPTAAATATAGEDETQTGPQG
jgi:hypothetical protein